MIQKSAVVKWRARRHGVRLFGDMRVRPPRGRAPLRSRGRPSLTGARRVVRCRPPTRDPRRRESLLVRDASRVGRARPAASPSTVVYVGLTLDGYLARPDGAVDYLPIPSDPSQDYYGFAAFMDSVDAVLMGRRTFQQVLEFCEGPDAVPWPYEGKTVYIVSRTITQSDVPSNLTGKAVISAASPAETLRAMRREGVARAYADGGSVVPRAPRGRPSSTRWCSPPCRCSSAEASPCSVSTRKADAITVGARCGRRCSKTARDWSRPRTRAGGDDAPRGTTEHHVGCLFDVYAYFYKYANRHSVYASV